jgi:aminopeptidase-like protein
MTSALAIDAREGAKMHSLAAELYPTCRSITGDGLRQTLRRIEQEIPITIREVPSGTPVLDWTIPDEWNISGAWIERDGERLLDFRNSNLHVVNYSAPFRGRLSWDELKPHLFSLPDRPNWIPYRTTYYKRDWGFCVAHRDLERFGPGTYDVCVESTLRPGALSYGELLLPGSTKEEFLISAHCCHPSLANDNLSGIVIAAHLAQALMPRERRLSYRFIFAPGTIGAIAWLARNEEAIGRIRYGLVLTCLGDRGGFNYKRSRQGNAGIDRIVEQALSKSAEPYALHEFSPYGYDERQFCSPGFNLPVGCLMRSQWGRFPEYHTNADNLEFIDPASLDRSLRVLVAVVDAAEQDLSNSHTSTAGLAEEMASPPSRQAPAEQAHTFLNLKPRGEPQLGKYGIYEALQGNVMPALWVLSLSDGSHSLLEIADRSALPFDSIAKAADVLKAVELIKELEVSS